MILPDVKSGRAVANGDQVDVGAAQGLGVSIAFWILWRRKHSVCTWGVGQCGRRLTQNGGDGKMVWFSYFCNKCCHMIPDIKLKISFQELSLRGSRVIAQQSETPFAVALEQVKRLKKTSKVKQSSKKSRPDL